ncbi:MAG: adenylate kinase [Clostridia bacterium]|nr:adenylate kinase [Clostridia bacterium]
MNIIFLGAPGAGKGTQAEKTAAALGIPTISTGNMIRAAVKSGTPLGEKVKDYIDKGLLVPDETVIAIVAERIREPDCSGGFILDGFPRTVPQAQALEDMGVKIDLVVDIEVDDESIKERMGGRRVCPDCGATYHVVTKRPAHEGVCDNCGAELIVRKDDLPETVAERLKIYHEQTEPLESFYRGRGVLRPVNGAQPIDRVTAEILDAVGVRD